MKTTKRIVSLALALLLFLTLLPGTVSAADVTASGNCGAEEDNLTWTLDSNGTLTISGSGAMADFTAMNSPWFEYRNSIYSLVLEERMTSIGEFAFFRCGSLTSVTIPESVTAIKKYAFTNCTQLSSVTILGSVTVIGGSAFQGCSSLTAFTIPDTVTSIGYSAFMECEALTCITIPESVGFLDIEAFKDCTGLTSVTILGPITTLDENVFDGCSSLAEITLPTSVTSIGNYAFRGCSSLTDITLPAGLASIGDNAFNACGSLTDITLPVGLASIGLTAFCNCSNLTAIDTETENAVYKSLDGVLFNKTGTQLLCFPAGKHGSYAVPDGVAVLAAFSFVGCTGLTELTIPQSVTGIGWYAFFCCTNLASVSIPESVTSIGYSAFSGCAGLTDVYYDGSASGWANIDIAGYNEELNEATIHYGVKDTFSVVFDANGGTGSMAAQTVKADTATALTACSFAREGHAFIGWNTEPDGTGTAYADGAEILLTADLTLYAQWVEKPTITTQPKNYIGAAGSTATATVVAQGEGLTYQWYFKNPGASSFTKSGSKTATYSATLTEANSGRKLYCVIKDANGNTVTSDTVTMSIGSAVSITTQPKNYVGAVGSTATATVVAQGEGLTYQWWFANPGATSFTKSGSKTATYSAKLTAANSGRRIYCVIKDALGNSVTTNTVTMTAALSITTQPENFVGAIGSTATATVTATGEGLTYQWYFANPGATSFTKSGSKTATYSATLTAANSGRRIYCVIKDANGNSVTSNTVTMTAAADPVSITTQPKDYVGAVGSTATATVTATGEGLTYQWWFANPGATSFTKSGSKTATYSATLTAANSGRRLYCVIKDASGNTVTTNTVTMTASLSITTQPKNYVGAAGSTATATVKATGEGLTYQWYFKNPGSSSFTKSGSKTATYSATLTEANSGRKLYCVITDANGNTVTSNTVTMTVG